MKKPILFVLILIFISIACNTEDPNPVPVNDATQSGFFVSTYAGSVRGDLDGNKANAQIYSPAQITNGPDNTLYFTDAGNYKVKKITDNGEVVTVAGTSKGFQDGPVDVAMFNTPSGIAISLDGSLFVSDSNRIRKISPEGIVSTLAGNGDKGFRDGKGEEAEFNAPVGLAMGLDGTLYVADMYNNAIRKIDADGNVTTMAGGVEGYLDGSVAEARFDHPSGIAVGENGEILIADTWNHRIRKISSAGKVTTIAGDGKGLEGTSPNAILVYPMDLSIDLGGEIFVADTRGMVIKIEPDGSVIKFAGSNEYGLVDGPVEDARFGFIFGLTVTSEGVIYVCDTWQDLIRKIGEE